MSERDMRDLIARLERQLGVSWARIVEWMRESNPEDEIEFRLRQRGIAGTLLVETTAAAERFAAAVTSATTQAGQRAATWLDLKVSDSLVSYDTTNFRAVQAAQRNRYELVREITGEQRSVINRVVSDGMRRGENPRVMAREIRESIGLTDHQSRAVASYRRALESGDWSNALGRALSDGRDDRTIRRIRSESGALTPEQVDAMTERYRKSWVSFRAETIARTEALRSANEGTRELFRQAVERGDVLATELQTTWHAGPRIPTARDEHQAMDERSVPYGSDFTMPDGSRMSGPGDPRGGARNTANCRCTTSTTYAPIPSVA